MGGVTTTNEHDPSGRLPMDLVMSGGGVKGIALAGAVAALNEAGYEPRQVSGTSAGGILGAMIAAGLRGEDLGAVARAVDYAGLLDAAPLEWLPVVGANDGIFAGERARDLVAGILADHGKHTFGDIPLDDPELPPERRYKLVVTCADLTLGRMVRLPWDYRAVYGLDPDEQSIAEAVRASMSVPLLFRPVTMPNKLTGRESALVDGGIVSNFPIDSLDRGDGRRPRWPTFGVTLFGDMPGPSGSFLPSWLAPLVPRPLRLMEQVTIVSIAGRDQAVLNQPSVQARTITVDSQAAGFLDFNLTPEQVADLYQAGWDATETFLATWDWEDYLKRFRTT